MSETLVPHPDAGRLTERFCARYADTYGPRGDVAFLLLFPASMMAVVGGIAGPAFLAGGRRTTGLIVSAVTVAAVAALTWTFYRVCYRQAVLIAGDLYDRSAARAVKAWASLRDPSLRMHARPVYAAFYREAVAFSIDGKYQRRDAMEELSSMLRQFGEQQAEIDVRHAEVRASKRIAALPGGTPDGDPVGEARAYLAALDDLNRLSRDVSRGGAS
jgi:hypothetical protein